MTIATTFTNTMTSTMTTTSVLTVEDTEFRAKLGAGVSAMECLAHMMDTHDQLTWTLGFSLSLSRILVASPLPSPQQLEAGVGVYLCAEPARQEEEGLALRYMAPEIDRGTKEEIDRMTESDRAKALSFTFGLLMWEISTGQAPFSSEVEEIAHKKIQRGETPEMEEIEESAISDVLRQMLIQNASRRLTLHEAAAMLREALDGEDDEDDSEEEDNSEEEIDEVVI